MGEDEEQNLLECLIQLRRQMKIASGELPPDPPRKERSPEKMAKIVDGMLEFLSDHQPDLEDDVDDEEFLLEGLCPDCHHELVSRSHQKITDALLDQPSYLKKWKLCPHCETIFYDEEDRVYNKGGH